jgi:hypothetical protein
MGTIKAKRTQNQGNIYNSDVPQQCIWVWNLVFHGKGREVYEGRNNVQGDIFRT